MESGDIKDIVEEEQDKWYEWGFFDGFFAGQCHGVKTLHNHILKEIRRKKK